MNESGSAYLGGFTKSFGKGNYDAFLVNYAINGTQMWNTIWGGSSSDEGRGVAVYGNVAVFLGGITDSFGSGFSVADRKMLRKARNALDRVSKEGKLHLMSRRAKFFSDALDEALRKK